MFMKLRKSGMTALPGHLDCVLCYPADFENELSSTKYYVISQV